jgi:hypothetical protein
MRQNNEPWPGGPCAAENQHWQGLQPHFRRSRRELFSAPNRRGNAADCSPDSTIAGSSSARRVAHHASFLS